jgi:RNA polymerase sigma factor (sigma-70 family)
VDRHDRRKGDDPVSVASAEYQTLTDRPVERWANLTEEQALLVRDHHTTAMIVARLVASRFSWSVVDVDDLRQEATIALHEAAARWDPDRGVKFNTYASRIVSGRIGDHLRDIDHLTRAHRRSLHEAGIDPTEVPATQAPWSTQAIIEHVGGDVFPSVTDDYDFYDERETLRAFLDHATTQPWWRGNLPYIVDRYLNGRVPMHVIGTELGVTESRISQAFKVFLTKAREWGYSTIDVVPDPPARPRLTLVPKDQP